MTAAYAYQKNEKNAIKVLGRELRISWKESYEVANALRGKKFAGAKRILQNVVDLKNPIPYRRYNRGGASHRTGIGPGRFPRNTARAFLKLLNNLEANASFKGIEAENLVLRHVATHKGSPVRNYYKGGPHFTSVTHVEMVAIPLEEKIQKKKEKTKGESSASKVESGKKQEVVSSR